MGKMRVVNRWTAAKTAYEEFKSNYIDTGRATLKAKRIAEALKELGAQPNPDDVDRIMQKDYCAQFVPLCSSCEDNPLTVVVLENSVDDKICALCVKCILGAFKLLEES